MSHFKTQIKKLNETLSEVKKTEREYKEIRDTASRELRCIKTIKKNLNASIRQFHSEKKQAPKRKLTTYQLFTKCHWGWVKRLNPYANNNDILRIIARMWNDYKNDQIENRQHTNVSHHVPQEIIRIGVFQ